MASIIYGPVRAAYWSPDGQHWQPILIQPACPECGYWPCLVTCPTQDEEATPSSAW